MGDWSVEFYVDHRGKQPAVEFANNLSAPERARARNVFRLLQEFGTSIGMPYARHIEGALWELRPGPNRFFYFFAHRSTLYHSSWLPQAGAQSAVA